MKVPPHRLILGVSRTGLCVFMNGYLLLLCVDLSMSWSASSGETKRLPVILPRYKTVLQKSVTSPTILSV